MCRAAKSGFSQVVEILLWKGVGVNSRDEVSSWWIVPLSVCDIENEVCIGVLIKLFNFLWDELIGFVWVGVYCITMYFVSNKMQCFTYLQSGYDLPQWSI